MHATSSEAIIQPGAAFSEDQQQEIPATQAAPPQSAFVLHGYPQLQRQVRLPNPFSSDP